MNILELTNCKLKFATIPILTYPPFKYDSGSITLNYQNKPYLFSHQDLSNLTPQFQDFSHYIKKL